MIVAGSGGRLGSKRVVVRRLLEEMTSADLAVALLLAECWFIAVAAVHLEGASLMALRTNSFRAHA